MAAREIDFTNPKVVTEVINTLVANTPIAYIVLDRERRIHFINEYFLRLRKLDPKAAMGNFCYNLSNNGVPCRECAVQDALETGNRCLITRKDILPDGTERFIDDYAIPLKNENGEFDYILELMLNRTNERRIKENNAQVFVGLIEALTAILDKKDAYTSSHSHDVTQIALKFSRHIGMAGQDVEDLRLASLLHDIGKIYVPDGVINKPGKLDDEEYRQIQRHPAETMNMLDNLSQFADIRDMAGHHHERWDGQGYPARLRGTEIPLGARIISIADTYDAMTSTRSYRRALSHETAVAEIRKCAGSQFDPELARKFVEMAEDTYASRERMVGDALQPTFRRRTHTAAKVERRLGVARGGSSTRILPENKLRGIFSDDMFASAIMENSPCYYTIVDENFNILFASENMAEGMGVPMEELRGMRCFELGNKTLECFSIEGGQVKCPVIRAFQTGTQQEGKTVNVFNGRSIHCDVYAVPIELHDRNGEPFRCVMEILLDRTGETEARMAMESDVKNLLDHLFQLVANMDEQTTSSSGDIIRKCADFSEYLSEMSRHMHALGGSLDLEPDETAKNAATPTLNLSTR